VAEREAERITRTQKSRNAASASQGIVAQKRWKGMDQRSRRATLRPDQLPTTRVPVRR
jgi:hypothetical protein